MSRADVPWVAAEITAIGLIWLCWVVAAFSVGAIPGFVVLGVPFLVVMIWLAVKWVLMGIYYPEK